MQHAVLKAPAKYMELMVVRMLSVRIVGFGVGGLQEVETFLAELVELWVYMVISEFTLGH